MTFRERFLTTLSGGRPDVLPWVADLTYWHGARQTEGTLPQEYAGDEGFPRLHADHHVGYYLGYATASVETLDGVGVSAQTEGHITATTWSTPVGAITGVTRYLPETFSGAHTKWPVETPVKHHWEHGRFIVGAADQIPPNGDMGLVRLVGELLEELCV